MPYEYATILKKGRKEEADQIESDAELLIQAQNAYLELTKMYNYIKIDCVKDDIIRTIDDINDDVTKTIEELIK